MLLGNLIESRRSKRPLGLQGLLSFGLHLGLGVFLVTATTSKPANDAERPPKTEIFLPPPDPRDVRPAHNRADRTETPLPDVPTIAVAPVTKIPDSIPPIVITEPFNSKLFVGGTGPTAMCPPACASAGESIGTAVLREDEVDEPARVVTRPTPRYPPVLQAAGLTGRVTLEFIVDATGHVESASVSIREGSDPGFVASATEAVRGSVFIAGKSKGQFVRQRMSQTISYRINAQ